MDETYLARLLREQGKQQTWLARQTKTDKQEIWKLAHGRKRMSERWAKLLAPYLGVSWVELLEGQPVEQMSPASEGRMAVRHATPQVGDPIKDQLEAALVAFWREQSLVKKAAILERLGFEDIAPSLVDEAGEGKDRSA